MNSLMLITFASLLVTALGLPSPQIHKNDIEYRFSQDNYGIVTTEGSLPESYNSKLNHGLCYEMIGCIDPASEFFWTPDSPETMLTKFAMYSGNSNNPTVIEYYPTVHRKISPETGNTLAWQTLPYNSYLIQQSQFNVSLPTRILVPGLRSHDQGHEEWMEIGRDLYLAQQEQNVILVTWTGGSHAFYPTAASSTRIVGRQIAVFLSQLEQVLGQQLHLDQVHLIGHSLGAHICGFAGQDINGKVARITGLDPAGPLFDDKPRDYRLDESDALFVDALHTSSGKLGLINHHLGTGKAIGNVDYYANGGNDQPGCKDRKFFVPGFGPCVCDHQRARTLFHDVIRMSTQSLRQDRVKPLAYLFEINEDEIMANHEPVRGFHPSQFDDKVPERFELDFVNMNPKFPRHLSHNATYYFKTQAEAPFFRRQHLLKLNPSQKLDRTYHIHLVAAINDEKIIDRKIYIDGSPLTLLFMDDRQLLGTTRKAENLQLSLYFDTPSLFDYSIDEIEFNSIVIEALDPSLNLINLEYTSPTSSVFIEEAETKKLHVKDSTYRS